MSFPRFATTSLGSLPYTELDRALDSAFALDIPCLPQLPAGGPSEFMLPQALEGFPGVGWDERGACTVDVAAWSAGREALEARLDAASSSDAWDAFAPSAESCRAWRPFLERVEARAPAFAKAQLVGPFTVCLATRTREGLAVLDVPGLEETLLRWVRARALAMVRALRRAGTTPLFFLDEPGLSAFSPATPWHPRARRGLGALVRALQREGARVGVHCCGNTDWAGLLDAGLDVLSLDVRLSLDAVLEESGPLARFLDAGATLALGLIPTEPSATYDVEELVDAVEVSLEAALPPGYSFEQLGTRVLLTPACGLASHSAEAAERILEQLHAARGRFREALPYRPTAAPRSFDVN